MNSDNKIDKIISSLSDAALGDLYSKVWKEKSNRDLKLALTYPVPEITGNKVEDIKVFWKSQNCSLCVARLAVEHAYEIKEM